MKKYLLAIGILLLVSCATQQGSPELKMTGVSIPINQMNNEIKLSTTLGMMETFKDTGVLELNLDNLSDNPITFSPDFGTKIFIQQGSNWTPIKNTFGYSDSGSVLPPKKDYALGTIVAVMPLLPSPSITSTIRIVVIGSLQGKDVGAYLDIDLSH